MTTIYHDADADLAALDGRSIAVVGYGNQGRCWALNLRDSGYDVRVHVRRDETRDEAEADGFVAGDIPDASDADVLCLLVPDDVIPELPIEPRDDALCVLATGYAFAFERFTPACDVGMVAPRMLGPEVRETYVEGIGFMTAVGVGQDATGHCKDRTLAVAKAIGGLRQGGIEMTLWQEAVLDLAVEQVLSPALRKINLSFTQVMAELGIPAEAILAELFLSGEVERTYRRLRLEGYAAQLEHHSPASQYGQLSRSDRFDDLDVVGAMKPVVEEITTGAFADEWDAERDAGHPRLAELKALVGSPEMIAWEADLRSQLGETAVRD